MVAINISDMVITSDKLVIPIYDPLKQTKKGKHMKPLEFRIYKEDEKLCVIDNLLTYLSKTEQYRSQYKLFLSYQKPHHAVSKDTITRWINDIMTKAGIDVKKHVTHSCRAAASSYAATRLVPIKRIIDACGWARESTFRRHYQKDITDMDTIGEGLLKD